MGWGRWRRWGEGGEISSLSRERDLKHILGVAGVVRLVAGLLSVRMGGGLFTVLEGGEATYLWKRKNKQPTGRPASQKLVWVV